MTTLALQHRPAAGADGRDDEGFDLLPFWFWVRAGIGLTVGGGMVMFAAMIVWTFFLVRAVPGLVLP